MELLCKWIRCLVWYSCVHHHPFIMICVCAYMCVCFYAGQNSTDEQVHIWAWEQLCVCVCLFIFLYFLQKPSVQRISSLLLTSIIGRGGHLRGWRSEGGSQAFCQAWQTGLTVYWQQPSKGSVTLTPVSLPFLGLYGRCDSGWPNGSSEHLPGAFQQHKEQQQSLSGQGSLKRVAVVGKSGRGRASQGSTQLQLIYNPKRRKGGKGGGQRDG